MITLADLRATLTRSLTHPASASWTGGERTAEGIARAYLPRTVWVYEQRPGVSALRCAVGVMGRRMQGVPLDLTDPGTVHALTVALALAHGRDPGPMGLGVSWRPWFYATGERMGWCLVRTSWALHYVAPQDRALDTDIAAPDIAAEPDAVRALVMACELAASGEPHGS